MRNGFSAPNEPSPFDDVDTEVQAARLGAAPRAFVLRVVRGRASPSTLHVDAGTAAPVLVGSSPVCALRVEEPGVSRRHVAFELAASGGLRLRDVGSTNGTRVGGVQVIEACLSGGEEVEVGGAAIRVEREATTPAHELPAETSFGRLFGASVAMRRLYPLFQRLASTTIPVVIEGETGTGKEALAQALHEAGPRSAGPFVVFDCTASAPNLLESELFGHERGAFTGATSSRPGVFQQAHGGTLLIDEIGELDLALQPKLLRALECSEVRPLGSSSWVRVDVRVLAATRRDLDREVADGRFRDDLFHRLAVARVELPPLRARRDDIDPLVRLFWREFTLQDRGGAASAGPPAALLGRWVRDPWPGNLRQLRNAVARAVAFEGLDTDALTTPVGLDERPGDDLVARLLAERLPLPVARERLVHDFERRYLQAALERHGGKVARAAAESGIALRYFQLLRQRRGGSG